METIILPFGQPAWERRKAVLREIITARPGPPYDFRGVLYIVPNERTVKTLKALFLDVLVTERDVRACIPPEITALNRFIVGRARSASVAPIIDDMAKGLLLEGFCRKAAGDVGVHGIPPEVLGPSLAPMLADALNNLYKFGVSKAAIKSLASESLPLTLLIKVKAEYEKWLDTHGLADLYYPAAYRPGQGEFKGITSVVMDGFYDADPVELSVLASLADIPDSRFILEAPGLSGEGSSPEGMPYYGTHRLLEALGGGSLPVPENDATSIEAEVFSGAVFGGRPLHESVSIIEGMTSFTREIKVVGALNPAEEVCFVAGSIKRACLQESLDPNKALVFFTDLDAYLPLLEEAFADAGIPYHLSQGYPLTQSPVVTALYDLLSLPSENYSFRAMRKVFSSPFVMLDGDGNRPDLLDGFARQAGITSGRRRWLEAPVTLRPRIDRLLLLVKPFDVSLRPLSGWTRAVQELIKSSGLAGKVEGLKDARPGLSHALDVLVGVIESLDEAARSIKAQMSLTEFLYILRKSLSGRRYKAGVDIRSGVRVLDALEVISEPFDVIYACGLIENSLPQARRPDLFFTPDTLGRLNIPGGSEVRTRDARLFLSLMLAAPRAFLCYPESRNGSPASPSPYIRALEPFFRADVIEKSTRVSRPMEPDKAQGPGEFMRALSFAASIEGIKAAQDIASSLKHLPEGTPGLERAKALLAPASLASPPRPPDKRTFRVTELEEYNLCHYRYYQGRVAGSAPPDEPEDDVAPHKAGILVHEILRDFYKDKKPVTASNVDESLTRLVLLANKKFEKLPDTTGNREIRRRFIEFIAPSFVAAEAEFSGTGYTVCGTEIPIEIEVDDKEAGHVVITGKIDRLELDREGKFNIVDYKTGSYPGSGKPLKDMFQLPLYAHILSERPELIKDGQRPTHPASLVYYNLKQGTMRDVVAYDSDVGPEAGRKTPRQRKKTHEEMDGLLKGAYETAIDAVRGILSGRFEPTCDSAFICQRCIYIAVCARGKGIAGEGAEEEAKGGDDAKD